MGPESEPPVGPDGRAGPHVFVSDLDAPVPEAADRHHLERVLRLRRGDPLTVSDGAGRWRPCRWGDELEPVGEVVEVPRPAMPVAVGFVPVKGDRPEWVVQKCTELGVDRLVVLSSERSVVRWEGDRAARHLERLAKVAREAAMQSRRCHLPQIDGVFPLGEVSGEEGIVRAEAGGRRPERGDRLVVVGPEGGWTDVERGLVPTAVGLADHVLRAETAAITATVLYTALRAGRVAGDSPMVNDSDAQGD